MNENRLMSAKYVIIGNSTGGIGAVEGIRKNDSDGSILIITNEPYHTYSRPLISYLLSGKTTEEKMKYRSNDFYEKNNCQLVLSSTVTEIHPDEKYIYTDNNLKITYDKLLTATGSSPFVPKMKGLETVKNQFTFASLDDAKALDTAISEDCRVLIVGAGLIGLKCAEGITKRATVTCVDLSERVLSSILDTESSQIVKEHLEKNGISFKLGRQVTEFKENIAILDDGSEIDFDVLVLAVGVRPNIDLIKNAGGKTQRGICIDEKCRTSLADIYAAGDCCESLDCASGEMKVMALLPNAYMQGECAGFNMSGAELIFNKAIPMNSIGFFGLHIITAGDYTGKEYFEHDCNGYKKIFYQDNTLKGYILIGNVEKAGIYTALIKDKTPLDSIDFELICHKPGLMAFSRDERKKKLGGVTK